MLSSRSPRVTGQRLRHLPVTGLLLAAALALGACSSDDAGDARDTDGAVTDDDAGAAGDGAAPGEAVASDADTSSPREPPSSQDLRGRHVIRTAEVVLEVRDSQQAADEVARIAEDVDGYVATSDLQRDANGVVRGRLTLRVPSSALDEVVDELDGLAESVPQRRIDEQDVTGEVTDIEAELTNLTAYEEQLRELLTEVREDGGGAEELVTVFERINEVRSRIERLESRQDVLADQVAMATVQVHLQPTASATPVGAVDWRPGETLHDAFASTTRALATVADGVIRLVVTVLPVTLVVLLPLVLVAWVLRTALRRRRGSVHRSTPPPPTDDGAQRSTPPPPTDDGG